MKPTQLDSYLQYEHEALTPWDTHEQQPLGRSQQHKRFISLVHPRKYTPNDSQSQRSQLSLKKQFTLRSLPQGNKSTRYGTLSQPRYQKQHQGLNLSQEAIKHKQVRIKHFILLGKENKGEVSVRDRLGAKRQSNYILKQKYANLRFWGKLSSSRQNMNLTIQKLGR